MIQRGWKAEDLTCWF